MANFLQNMSKSKKLLLVAVLGSCAFLLVTIGAPNHEEKSFPDLMKIELQKCNVQLDLGNQGEVEACEGLEELATMARDYPEREGEEVLAAVRLIQGKYDKSKKATTQSEQF